MLVLTAALLASHDWQPITTNIPIPRSRKVLPQSWFVARSITRASTTAEFLLWDQIVSYHNRFPAKRRLRFDWKKRSQDRECLRLKREHNDYRDYCTSHARRTIL
jgi:hypothetical protein